jgi:hypothetical protein
MEMDRNSERSIMKQILDVNADSRVIFSFIHFSLSLLIFDPIEDSLIIIHHLSLILMKIMFLSFIIPKYFIAVQNLSKARSAVQHSQAFWVFYTEKNLSYLKKVPFTYSNSKNFTFFFSFIFFYGVSYRYYFSYFGLVIYVGYFFI